MENIFDTIYVSSYENSPRLEHLQNQLKYCNIPYEIVYGENYKNININNLIIKNKVSKELIFYLKQSMNDDSVKRYIANYFGHFEIWKKIKENPEEKILILEDDIRFFFDKDKDYFKKLFKNEPPDWEILKLGWEQVKKNECDNYDDNDFIQHIATHNYLDQGAMCYVVKKSIIDIFIDNSRTQHAAIDGYLSFLIGNPSCFTKNIKQYNLSIKRPLKCYRSKKIMGFGASQKNCITNAIFRSASQ